MFKKLFLVSLAVAFSAVAAVAGWVSSDTRYLSPVAPILCSGSSSSTIRIVVVGDSWASARKIDAGLSSAFPVPVRICSVGFSGFNTKKIADALLVSDPRLDRLEKAVGGRADYAVILAGVNDIVGHYGPEFYAFHAAQIRDRLSDISEHVAILELPYVNTNAPSSHTFGDLEHWLYRWLFDAGVIDPTDAYRAALSSRVASAGLIPSPILTRDMFRDDVHLKESEYRNLGSFIGAGLTQLFVPDVD
ncbi:MAG: hypothetical protein EOQ56_25635 [Mesorhizobium sp.]|nr:MAG: hypothetical protein EOQ56_25635 [Mesorhizobium sp.]